MSILPDLVLPDFVPLPLPDFVPLPLPDVPDLVYSQECQDAMTRAMDLDFYNNYLHNE